MTVVLDFIDSTKIKFCSNLPKRVQTGGHEEGNVWRPGVTAVAGRDVTGDSRTSRRGGRWQKGCPTLVTRVAVPETEDDYHKRLYVYKHLKVRKVTL